MYVLERNQVNERCDLPCFAGFPTDVALDSQSEQKSEFLDHGSQIASRIDGLCYNLDKTHIDSIKIAQSVMRGICAETSLAQIDTLTIEICAAMATVHSDYSILASRIAISNLHEKTSGSFYNAMRELHEYGIIDNKIFQIIRDNSDELDNAIDYTRDYNYNYFGYKTLEKSYLLKIEDKIIERPQHLLMRVAIGIHKADINRAIQTYTYMSQGFAIHATPCLYNAGTKHPQMSSCFLIDIKDDSIDGIFNTLKDCAAISKTAGGIGLNVHKIRANNSYIAGSNGYSSGIIPMLRIFNDTSRYVNQSGRRSGSFAIYLELWHADIEEYLQLKRNTGPENSKIRDLFYALWVSDLFMHRVENNEQWSLFSPSEAPGLDDVWGLEFSNLYEKYEKENRARKTICAQKLWFTILESQIETGNPFILYKDSCNAKSNHKNLGTIKSSNLCCEIVQYSSPSEIAVCNLASVALCKFVEQRGNKKIYNHSKLYEVTRHFIHNIDKIIDENYYPVEEAERSNMRHRPLGLGVQGLADTFILMRFPFNSPESRQLNKDIFETMYFAALCESCALSKIHGTYESYPGSPISQGVLQFDMWGITPSNRWNWPELRESIKKYGVRNSLLIALMPTASSSSILGNNECFEPFTSNLYSRRVLSGDFQMVNKYLLNDLNLLGIWNEELKNKIIMNNGSVQGLAEIPKELQDLYKTVWEIPQKCIIDMCVDRGPFVDQSQSMNLFMENVTLQKLSSAHFYGWKKGLKTGMYYLRTKPSSNAIKFSIPVETEGPVCRTEEGCTMCSA